MNPTIISLTGTSQRGKTGTLREVAIQLLNNFSLTPIPGAPSTVPPTGDFWIAINIHGTVVAIDSKGDPNTDLTGRLKKLAVHFKADLIFCATRTHGETYHAVTNLESRHGYSVIRSAPYLAVNNHDQLNHIKAIHLIDLATRLNLLSSI